MLLSNLLLAGLFFTGHARRLHLKNETMPCNPTENHGTTRHMHESGLERHLMLRPLADILLAFNRGGFSKSTKGNPPCTATACLPKFSAAAPLTARFATRKLIMGNGSDGQEDLDPQTPVEDEGIATEKAATNASDLHHLLLSRRTVNNFEKELPAGWEDSIRRAVQAATFAPNHKNTEPWRFHLLGRQASRLIVELNTKMVTAKKGSQAGMKKFKRWLAIPGWLVVTCVKSNDDDGSMDDPTGIAREDYAACCCAVQNFCLSLHADGIGTKWTTGPVNFHPLFGEAFGLPSDEYVVGTIWFGLAEKQPGPPSKKLSVDDVLIRHD